MGTSSLENCSRCNSRGSIPILSALFIFWVKERYRTDFPPFTGECITLMLQSPFVPIDRIELPCPSSKPGTLAAMLNGIEPSAGIEPASPAYKAGASPKMLAGLFV